MTARTAYLAAEGYVDELAEELGAVGAAHGRLLVASGPPRPAAWAANVWLDPQEIRVASISDAAAKLRAIQRNWAVYAPVLHRRAILIQQQLPKVSAKPLVFGARAPTAPLGSWTLLDAGNGAGVAALHEPVSERRSALCRGPFRAAEPRLSEIVGSADLDRLPAGSPARLCLDLGSEPRRLELGVAADGRAGDQRRQGAAGPRDRPPARHRAPAGQRLCRSTRTRSGRSTGCFPMSSCYPARLLALVERWLAAGTCRRFVCTIKFQGETDHAAARRFAAIPGSQLRHLFHNRHELTWSKID